MIELRSVTKLHPKPSYKMNKHSWDGGISIMKKIILPCLLAIFLLLQGCMSTDNGQSAEPQTPPATSEQPNPTETAQPQQPSAQPEQPSTEPEKPAQQFQNDIFKEVTVSKVKEDTYTVKGKAMVFEAVVDYVVEDGHNELAKGSVQASKGAPEWGDFEFTVTVKKDVPNSTLMLILYETSAKDGSRRMELPIALPES